MEAYALLFRESFKTLPCSFGAEFWDGLPAVGLRPTELNGIPTTFGRLAGYFLFPNTGASTLSNFQSKKS